MLPVTNDSRDRVPAIHECNLIIEDDKIYVEVEKESQMFEKQEIKTAKKTTNKPNLSATKDPEYNNIFSYSS